MLLFLSLLFDPLSTLSAKMNTTQFTCPEADEPVTHFPSVPHALWQFPILAPIPLGDPASMSMQITALHQDRIENTRLKEESVAHTVLLRLKGFQLEEAQKTIANLELKVGYIQERLEATEARLKEFEAKEEAMDRLAKDIWSTRTGAEPDVTWDPPPVLLDGPVDSSSLLGQPLTLERVLDDMGYHYSLSDLQKLSVLVYREYVKVHGRAPFPSIYYGHVGQAQGLSGFTEKDRPLIMSVVEQQSGKLFHKLFTAPPPTPASPALGGDPLC